jgi:type I restriction enzyme S subunit
LPLLTEQIAITGALSDADALIESLEQLVAKKRQIKHGAMQQLLTGQKRLPGFTGKWVETTLGGITTFLSGGTPSRTNEDYWTGDIPWISAMSLRCFEIWRSDSNVTKEAVVAGSKMAPVGSSLLLVRGSALHKEILCGLVTRPVCFNQDVKALVPNSHVVPRFLTLFLKGTAEELLKLVSSAGNTAGVLDTKLLKALAISLPKTDEQTAIAAVLTDMDAEIVALEGKLAKGRQVKQGMMQELLTGRIRLV